MNDLPVLYSFRRCPYAIRARMAVAAAGIEVTIREVLLKDKPPALIAASAKATVPVLVLPDGNVIDESLEIMSWALTQRDPLGWLSGEGLSSDWIQTCDGEFKYWLDRYKYADRHPEHTAEHYRREAEVFLRQIEDRLTGLSWLGGEAPSVTDVALFPFVRQFAGVEPAWWQGAPYPGTRIWLAQWLEGALFSAVMTKYPRWEPGQPGARFPTEPCSAETVHGVTAQ